MSNLIYISPTDLDEINGLSELRNTGTLAKYLDPIDFHFILFSTLYQSGVSYFQTNEFLLPNTIRKYNFWTNKIIPYDRIAFIHSLERTSSIVKDKIHFAQESPKTKKLQRETISQLSNLFYSFETGSPFLNTNFSLAKHLEHMESRMDKNLYLALLNLSSLIIKEDIQTITPKYSVLKEDIKRFEDIAMSTLFRKYSDSLCLLSDPSKLSVIKKDIKTNSFKLLNKYGHSLNLKETAFSFIKFNKTILDLFVSKIPSTIGDFVIQSLEKMTKEKRKVYFYEVEEVKYWYVFCNLIQDCIKKHGPEKFKTIFEELKNE
jgi:hypothetical protein